MKRWASPERDGVADRISRLTRSGIKRLGAVEQSGTVDEEH
jgi:hypothetical protein